MNLDDCTDEVALFTPKLEETAPVGLDYGVARKSHVEEDAAIFKESRGGMGGEIFFEDFGEFGGG